MLRDLLGTVAFLGVGWYVWHELHGRGMVPIAPPNVLGTLREVLPGTSTPAASADVDQISDNARRAIAYARQAQVPERDVELVGTFILHESAANPLAHNTTGNQGPLGEDSRGLMQVRVVTAQGMYDDGTFRQVPRDQLGQALFDPVIGVQIGYAYLKANRNRVPRQWGNRELEWLVRSYNGGPGWTNSNANAQAMTAQYWATWQGHRRQISAALQSETTERPRGGGGR